MANILEGNAGGRQFRFSYFTSEYEATVAFYRDGLGLPILESWDRNPDDRGTLFAAASGVIEVLARPSGAEPAHLWDRRHPQGAFMVIEVEDVDAEYRRAVDRRLSIRQELADQEWGHRGFCLVEPNGLVLYLFGEIAGRRG
jgi:catechol 2,3-dioxygenase-like lactoylglutathione lyase family enzyme